MSNQTAGIEDDTERYIWAVYHIIVFLSSLIGDSLILYASFKDAFKLNKFIVAIIRHIAACDLIFAVFSVLPSAVSLLANSWVLGRFLCVARFYLGNISFIIELHLIACLTISKLLLLKFPIRCSNWTEKMGHVTCCFISTVALPFTLTFLVTDIKGEGIGFTYNSYTCVMLSSAIIRKYAALRYFFVILDLIAPTFVTSIATIPTLAYLVAARKSAQRVRANVPWQGALTVVLTAVMCCLSTLPKIIYIILTTVDKKFGNIKIARTAQFLMVINIMSNFYIYTLTIRSFRKFLHSLVASFMSRIRRANTDITTASGKSTNYQLCWIFFRRNFR